MTYRISLRREVVDTAPAVQLRSPADAASYLMRHCYDKEDMYRESSHVILLDNDKNVLAHSLVSIGDVDKSTLDYRIVAKLAVDSLACGVVLSHCHPSGSLNPSVNDVKTTEEIRNALSLFDIALVDHIIVSDTSFFSFSDGSVRELPK